MTITITKKVCLVLSVICFVLYAFGFKKEKVNFGALGMAFFVGSFIG